MQQLITQIQDVIFESNLSTEEKQNYISRLGAMKEIELNETDKELVKKTLEKVLEQIKEKPEAIKEFFASIEQVFNVYLEQGAQGVVDKLDKELS